MTQEEEKILKDYEEELFNESCKIEDAVDRLNFIIGMRAKLLNKSAFVHYTEEFVEIFKWEYEANKKMYDDYKQNKMLRFRTQHAAILEDVINNIYENDREYFDKNIATSAPFDSLCSLYREEFKRDPKTITWDDMYNY